MRICAAGADLTAKCHGIPAFVNQLAAGVPLSVERQYLVQFISDSSAGFVINDVKLTREFFMKEILVFAGISSGLVTILSRVFL